MTYLFDNQTLFDAALAKLTVEPHIVEAYTGPPYVGQPGVRDPEHPCDVFTPGEPDGDCESDGHYVCSECRHLVREKWLLQQQPETLSLADCKTLLGYFGVGSFSEDPDLLRYALWKILQEEL
jgi:hypothetical protein